MKMAYKIAKKFIDNLNTTLIQIFLKILFRQKYRCGGGARFAGAPRILPLAGKIIIGRNARLSSRLLSNILGVNHPVIIASIQHGEISIGDDFHISGGSIVARKNISIGDNVYIGANCTITDSDHHEIDFQRRRDGKSSKIQTSPINIGDDVWIGANVTILKGVNIGNRSIIGAGVTVRRSVPADTILGANN